MKVLIKLKQNEAFTILVLNIVKLEKYDIR